MFTSFQLRWKKYFSSICTLLCLYVMLDHLAFAQTLPEGFQKVLVTANLASPTAIAFAPDGRIFIANQGGSIRIVKNGSLLSTPFLKISTRHFGESGLTGITLDPNFASNQYIYVYYTLPDGSRNRVSRFTGNGDIASLSSELVLLNLDQNGNSANHMGGALHFGKDGKLYIAVGDNTISRHSPNLDTYFGKILRINANGTIPTDNPFSTGSEQKRRIWVYGVRNPFTIDVQPQTGRIFVNDVGNNSWEEINDATTGGKNFGWPSAEGNSTNTAFSNPVYTYPHGEGANKGCAITGGVFFNPPQTNYPSKYIGKYFYNDYCNNWVNYLDITASPVVNNAFGTSVGNGLIALNVGLDGNLYFLERASASLYKIVYSNLSAPAIVTHPVSKSVSAGQPVSFSVTATGTSPLNYQWQKNGTNINGATNSSYTITSTSASHAGNYRVIVSNSWGTVISNSAQLTVSAFNATPVAVINTPTVGSQYRGGQTLQFSGSATDQEDGTLPASAFEWYMTLYHNTHNHPVPAIAVGTKSGTFTFPIEGETSSDVFYRLSLIVKDSEGLKDTVSRDILPFKTTLSFDTRPSGLQLLIDGTPVSTPQSIVGVEGVRRTIGAATQSLGGITYSFSHWLHGGSANQTILTPVDNTTYTAVFTESSSNASLYRSVNLNSSLANLIVDGINFPGNKTISNFSYTGRTYENQSIPLVPSTDENRAKLIRSNIYGTSSSPAVLRFHEVEAGSYQVYIYVWEDNNPTIYSLFIEGKSVVQNYNSGSAGSWSRLGPFTTDVSDGELTISTSGGDASLSAVEIWSVETAPIFERAINLNSSVSLSIDGKAYQASSTAPNFTFAGRIYENQTIPLSPTTDANRARMIRSSIYSTATLSATLNIGTSEEALYDVYVYQWEDNIGKNFSLKVNNEIALNNVFSGNPGQWFKRGPFRTFATNRAIKIEAYGGEGNLSGVELFRVPNSSSATKVVNDLMISPNPVSQGNLRVQSSGEVGDLLDVAVTNSFGKVVIDKKLLRLKSSPNAFDVDVSQLNEGVYFLTVKGRSSLWTKRFLIQK